MRVNTVVVSVALAAATVVRAAAQCPEGQTPGTIEGLILNADGTPRPDGLVSLRAPSDTGERLALASKQGFYQLAGLCPGPYSVRALDGTAVASLTLAPGQTLSHHVRLPAASRGASAFSLVPLLLFLIGLLLYRHHNIVRTNRELLLAQADNLKERIRLESDGVRFPTETQQLCDRAYEVKADFQWRYPAEWFFWSRGRELAAWTRLHELERQVVAFLVPEPRVVERAVYAETQLRGINSPTASVVADRMRQTLQEIVATGGAEGLAHGHAVEHLKQQLGEALAIIYDYTDTKFAELTEWHNKAMFLVYLALLGIGVLAIAFGHEELFLVGAVGGLMSRMTRSLFREEVPNDYGASWTTLFLSPLLGALSAWIGVTLIVWLRHFDVLGEAFDVIRWDVPTDAVMVATAFTLGFSERLFTSLLSKVEGQVQQDLDKRPQAAAPPAPLTTTAMTATNAPGSTAAAHTVTRLDRIVADLDLQSGERAAFVGPTTSPVRAALVPIVGASHLFDATPATLAQHPDLDAVLFETLPAAGDVATLATTLATLLRPDGRVVFVGRTPAALFDADAATQQQQGHVGPAVVTEALVAQGIPPQDPPEKLDAADPVEWIASFIKPAVGGSDR